MSFYYSECIYKPLGKIHLFLSPVVGRQIPVHSQFPSLYGNVIFAFQDWFTRLDAS